MNRRMRSRHVIHVALLAAAAAVATAAALAAAPAVAATRRTPAVTASASAPSGSITVTGQAQVPVTDLQATFDAGVEQQASTAQAALAADDQAMRRVIAALKAKGVPAQDLQTQNLSVNPQYQQNVNASGPGKIVGFDANDTLTVTVTNPAQVGALIDTALTTGANTLDGVSFVAAHPAQMQRQALTAAVADARSQALALASAAGLTLGPATTINTQVQGVEPMYAGVMAASAAPAPRTPVLSGAQYVSAQVTVTFSAQPG